MGFLLSSAFLGFFIATIVNLQSVFSAQGNGITCELPEHPKNGRWTVLNGDGRPGDRIPKDSVVKFECDPGYKLSSKSAYIPCDAKWSLSHIPVCEKKCSPKYSTPTTILKCEDKYGNTVPCDEAVDGTYLSSSCIPFYETPLGYKKTILCVEGTWNFPNPVCQPVCGKKIDKDTIKLIYKGKKAEKRDYPWIIALYQKERDEFNNVCGGSLISQRIILTAAHCVTNDYGDILATDNFMIGAGKYYRKYQDSRDTDVQYAEVARIAVHKGYKGPAQRFLADIALLITKELIIFTDFVQPVCYQDLPSIYLQAGKIGVVAGWGTTEEGEQPDELRLLEIPYKYETTCAKELPPGWADTYNTVDKICAGFFNENKSVCTGDSGSGLYFKNPEDNRYYVHGLVSIAPALNGQCNPQQNALYTSVAQYYEFVDRETTRQYVEQCSLPLYPNNGKWIVTKHDKKPGDIVPSNTILKVECNQGYGLSSHTDFIDCESASALPKCELLCPKLDFPLGAVYKCTNNEGREIDCSRAVHGTSLNYTCPEGSSRPSNQAISCKNGSWGRKPECKVGDTAKRNKRSIVVCSYASWWARDKVFPEDLNTTLCTHIVYSFIGLWEKGDVKVHGESVELDRNQKGIYRRFTDLKENNKDLKILLSIGTTEGSDSALFSTIAGDESKKVALLYSAMYIVETYKFDGLNIEWFYPQPKDKINYISLLRDLRQKCNEKGLLLTATVRSDPDETGYDGAGMTENLDWIHIRNYDFYGPWSSYTGQNSPLYASSNESDWEKYHLNIEAATRKWITFGVPKTKLVMSIAFYGRSLILQDQNRRNLHSPIKGAGIEDGFVRYSTICMLKNWTTVWDDEQKSAYSYRDDQWIGYDNKESVRIKAEYAKNNGFLGVNVWPVDGDDVSGKCGSKQILLKQVHLGLGNQVNLDE